MERPISGVKTLGGWIRVRRIAKNLAPYHLAQKMGIAPTVIFTGAHEFPRNFWSVLAHFAHGDQLNGL